jgi:hypothetical protein
MRRNASAHSEPAFLLRECGPRLEEYDLPEVKTEGDVSATGGFREAWFRDPDGNIVQIHAHVYT